VAVENKAVVVFIAIGIVAVDFHDFGNEAATRPPLKVHDDIHGITDIRFNRAERQIHAALQHTTCEPGQGLLRRSGMNRGETPRVSRVEKLEKIERLASANFT